MQQVSAQKLDSPVCRSSPVEAEPARRELRPSSDGPTQSDQVQVRNTRPQHTWHIETAILEIAISLLKMADTHQPILTPDQIRRFDDDG